MIRGTTPTLIFKLPMQPNLFSCAYVTISQNGAVAIDKPLDDCICGDNQLSVTLTQAETLSLATGNCDIQIRAKTLDGNVIASRIITVNTDKILKDGVI